MKMSKEKLALLKLAEDCIKKGDVVSLKQAELYINLADMHH